MMNTYSPVKKRGAQVINPASLRALIGYGPVTKIRTFRSYMMTPFQTHYPGEFDFHIHIDPARIWNPTGDQSAEDPPADQENPSLVRKKGLKKLPEKGPENYKKSREKWP
jgi:hypothetical protein